MGLDAYWGDFLAWLPFLLFLANVLIITGCIAWALMTKSDSTSAVAWCLLIFFLPLFGAAFFYLFGYQHVERPLHRKRRHRMLYKPSAARTTGDADEPPSEDAEAGLD